MPKDHSCGKRGSGTMRRGFSLLETCGVSWTEIFQFGDVSDDTRLVHYSANNPNVLELIKYNDLTMIFWEVAAIPHMANSFEIDYL